MGGSQSTQRESDAPMQQVDLNAADICQRPHPQESFSETTIALDSFFGQIRSIFGDTVLQTQLDQLRHQGSYDAFGLKWNPKWDIRRLHGAKCPIQGSPPTLYWDSDVGKWIEAACYFLASGHPPKPNRATRFVRAIDDLVSMMEKAQQPDGYLGTYFTVVDRQGKLKNLRDMHEMYCCGHLLEAALAHHHYTGSDRFLKIMIRYVDLLSTKFGPGKNQLHGYPGHPELELAVLRLYSRTKDPKHYAFAKYLLEARGRREPDLEEQPFFVWEAIQRKDDYFHRTMDRIDDGRYHQWHAPLHEQDAILGHSVRALYLITAAANMNGRLLADARRLWTDAVDHKMYPTGGFGSDPRIEGFSEVPHFLPNGEDEGGCYAETCASIGAMMVSERLLSHQLDGKVRDVLERSLMNTVLGGASLDGKTFFYDNPLSTSGSNTADRSEWFDVCCCPPNLCRTVGLLGGYAWFVKGIDIPQRTIRLDVYLYMSASREIKLPDGSTATATMKSEMPWRGATTVKLDAPVGWKWQVNVPRPDYASNFRGSVEFTAPIPGFATILVESCEMGINFDLPVRLLTPHPATHQDTITVSRGPFIYTAERYDNAELEKASPHFSRVGVLETAVFSKVPMTMSGVDIIALKTDGVFFEDRHGVSDIGSMRHINGPARTWRGTSEALTLIPFFARCNRQKGERIRTSFLRVGAEEVRRSGGPV